MKLLLCLDQLADFKPLLDNINDTGGQMLSPLPDNQSANFTLQLRYLQHEIDICETGLGSFQSAYKITKTLLQKRYHLAIKASLGNAYNSDINIGDVVNVIKDKPGDVGNGSGMDYHDLYDLQLLNRDSFPHYKGGFINMNNSYMNVFMPYKKVVSVTVNKYADSRSFQMRKDKYQADVETRDGLHFVYACMYERQPFYQIVCVENNLPNQTQDRTLSIQSLNNTLFDILQKI